MFINHIIKIDSCQQNKPHKVLKMNQPKEKNAPTKKREQQEKKQSPKKAVKYTHLIGIIIF